MPLPPQGLGNAPMPGDSQRPDSRDVPWAECIEERLYPWQKRIRAGIERYVEGCVRCVDGENLLSDDMADA